MARRSFTCSALVAALLALSCAASVAAEPFPFGKELLLDGEPMRPGKRMPILLIEQDGNAKIDLWCRTVQAHVEISDTTIKIEAGRLPEDLPAMQGAGQCSPERIEADEQMRTTLSNMTSWRWDEEAILLIGPTTMKFRSATN
jgi:hypothetical protein